MQTDKSYKARVIRNFVNLNKIILNTYLNKATPCNPYYREHKPYSEKNKPRDCFYKPRDCFYKPKDCFF